MKDKHGTATDKVTTISTRREILELVGILLGTPAVILGVGFAALKLEGPVILFPTTPNMQKQAPTQAESPSTTTA